MNSLLLAIFIAAPAAALTTDDIRSVDGQVVETEDDRLARQMRATLETDSDAAHRLTQRIMDSTLGEVLAGTDDPHTAYRKIRTWIETSPGDAAHLAVGFAGDDARGDKSFERSLFHRVKRYFELNPGRNKGILGRLDGLAVQGKKIAGIKDLDDADGREMLRKFFEGRGSGSGKVGRAPDPEKGARPESAGPAAFAGASLYDRLGAGNLTGYSPDVMTFQSAMNQRRPPGAPKLIETGRLNHATLRFPYHSLRYDIDNLEKNLRVQRAWALARLLGMEKNFSTGDYRNPKIQRELETKARGKKLDPEFALREKAVADARRVLREFDREAKKTKTRGGITALRVHRLSALRQSAAVSITLAAQLERLQRLKSLRGFIAGDLLAAVARAPVEEKLKSAYLSRGKNIEARLETALRDGGRAAKLLASAVSENIARAEKILPKTLSESKRLPRLVGDYRAAPFAFPPSSSRSRPRAWLDDLILRFLPDTDYARRLKKNLDKERAALKAFRRIAKSRN